MKWLFFLTVFLLVRLAFKKALAATPGRWFDPHMIAATAIGNAVIYSLFLWTATALSNADESWLVRLAWHFRGLAWINQTQIGAVIAAMILTTIAAVTFAARSGVYLQTVATSLEKLAGLILAIFVVAIYAQYTALTASAIWSVWFDEYEWAPPLSPFVLKSLSLSWGIGVLIGAVVAIALTLAIAYDALRPFLFLVGLIRPYASGEDLVYENFDLSLERGRVGEEPKNAKRILLISDLHITRQDLAPIHSARKSGESQSFILKVLENVQPELIIVAGDITDVGDPHAWNAASKLFSQWRHKVFSVLGNHDIHFYRSFVPSYLAPMSVDQKQLRKNLLLIEGRSFERFPRIERLPDLSLVLVGLDSNRRPPSTPLTNAIGEVGSEQLRVARDDVEEVRKPGDLIIVVVHHQIISPKFSLDGLYLRCLDAAEVLAFASEIGAGAIIHGHKHMPYLARSHDGLSPLIISCGSTHHLPDGPFADEARQPSAYEISISDGCIHTVSIIRDTSVSLATAACAASRANAAKSERG